MNLYRNSYSCTTRLKAAKERKYLYRRQIRKGFLMYQKKFMTRKEL